MTFLLIDCSSEQADEIAEHFITQKEIVILGDERVWMYKKAREQFPHCKILSAELQVHDGTWKLEIDPTFHVKDFYNSGLQDS